LVWKAGIKITGKFYLNIFIALAAKRIMHNNYWLQDWNLIAGKKGRREVLFLFSYRVTG
jgi:hypothetical protein